MTETDALRMAVVLMDKHGLGDWIFRLDNAKRRAGCCRHRRKEISLSIHHVQLNSENEVKDTILHEIAHALCGPKEGHGPTWKTVCLRIGARPERCYDRSVVTMPLGKYRATCGGCAKVYRRYRNLRKHRYAYCLDCGPERGRLDYKIVSE